VAAPDPRLSLRSATQRASCVRLGAPRSALRSRLRAQVSVIRESVAAVYEAEESWTQAAQVLAGIELDSGQRVLDATYKLQKCIKIAQLYLVRA
jgi:hypothetical protein